MKNSGLGLGFLARDKVKLKRLLSRLRLEFQGEVLSVLYDGHNEQTLWPRQGYAAQKYFYIWSSCLNSYRLTISRQRSYCWSTTIDNNFKIGVNFYSALDPRMSSMIIRSENVTLFLLMFKKNVWLINFFATQQFRSFRWLIFPSKLLAESWKLHKLLTELISSFSFWI